MGGSQPSARPGPPARDPGFEVIPRAQVREAIANVRWGPLQDGVSYGRGEHIRLPDIRRPDGTSLTRPAFTRPTGVTVLITEDMLGTGTPASQALREHTPGFRDDYRFDLSHLLGKGRGGDGDDPRNIVAGHAHMNRGAMSVLERRVDEIVRRDGQAYYTVIPEYVGNEPIPRSLLMSVRSPNDAFWVRIPNIP